MKIRWVLMVAVMAMGIGGWAGFGLADEEPAGDPSHDEMMEMMMKLHAPGEAQATLDAIAGDWDAVSKLYMEPGKPPQESKGSGRNEWTNSGRMLRVFFDGSFFGQAYHGEGHLGHDNDLKEYQSTWTDSMSTGIFYSDGSWDAEAKQLTLKGIWKSSMGEMPQRMVYTLIGPDEYTIHNYMTQGEQEILHMEIAFTRKVAGGSGSAGRCCPPRKKMPYTGTRRP